MRAPRSFPEEFATLSHQFVEIILSHDGIRFEKHVQRIVQAAETFSIHCTDPIFIEESGDCLSVIGTQLRTYENIGLPTNIHAAIDEKSDKRPRVCVIQGKYRMRIFPVVFQYADDVATTKGIRTELQLPIERLAHVDLPFSCSDEIELPVHANDVSFFFDTNITFHVLPDVL